MPTAVRAEPVVATRYAVAVRAIAAEIAAELAREDLTAEAAWDRAETALLRHEGGPHRWIFQGLEPLVASENVFEALEARPDGSRDWLHASVTSAARAVARFDVLRELSDDPRMEVE